MAVNKPTYRVELQLAPDAEPQELLVEVLAGDQLRAELEAPRHSIPTNPAQAPLHTAFLWVWASLVRTKRISCGFQEFKAQLVAVEKADQVVPDAVVPTTQDQATPSP